MFSCSDTYLLIQIRKDIQALIYFEHEQRDDVEICQCATPVMHLPGIRKGAREYEKSIIYSS